MENWPEGSPPLCIAAGETNGAALQGVKWAGLGGWERWLWIAARGKLWHVWGRKPSWVRALSFRTRVLHTPLGRPETPGGLTLPHVSGSGSQAGITVGFDKEMLWNMQTEIPEHEDENPGVFVLFPSLRRLAGGVREALAQVDEQRLYWIPLGAVPRHGKTVLPLDMRIFAYLREKGGVLVVPTQPGISDTLLAALAALLAVPTVCPSSRILDETLGPAGYVHVAEQSVPAWSKAIACGRREGGRAAAAQARRRLGEYNRAGETAQALKAFYTTVAGGIRP